MFASSDPNLVSFGLAPLGDAEIDNARVKPIKKQLRLRALAAFGFSTSK